MPDYEASTSLCRRDNWRTREIVRVGCVLQDIRGTAYAAHYLSVKDVPFEVAHRVLLRHHLRRRVR